MTLMKQFASENPVYTLVAFIPPDGKMTCSGSGDTFDFSTNARFLALIADPKPGFVVNRARPVSGTAVLGVVDPVFDATGKLLGVISLSIPHQGVADRGPIRPANWVPSRLRCSPLTDRAMC